jgi:hypothetical protein
MVGGLGEPDASALRRECESAILALASLRGLLVLILSQQTNADGDAHHA